MNLLPRISDLATAADTNVSTWFVVKQASKVYGI
jgi:hypothetical protein